MRLFLAHCLSGAGARGGEQTLQRLFAALVASPGRPRLTIADFSPKTFLENAVLALRSQTWRFCEACVCPTTLVAGRVPSPSAVFYIQI